MFSNCYNQEHIFIRNARCNVSSALVSSVSFDTTFHFYFMLPMTPPLVFGPGHASTLAAASTLNCRLPLLSNTLLTPQTASPNIAAIPAIGVALLNPNGLLHTHHSSPATFMASSESRRQAKQNSRRFLPHLLPEDVVPCLSSTSSPSRQPWRSRPQTRRRLTPPKPWLWSLQPWIHQRRTRAGYKRSTTHSPTRLHDVATIPIGRSSSRWA